MTYVTANVPVGAYDINRRATLGLGRWALDGGAGYSYFDEDKGHEFSSVVGFTYNFMNPYTAYRSGIDMHVELSASQYLTDRFLVGVAGYFYNQITGDDGPGATLGPFMSRVAGLARSSALTSPSAAGRPRSAPGATMNLPARTGRKAGMPG